MQSFRINNTYTVVCEHHNTRSGFKHEAVLLANGREQDRAKCTYLNRTWERYTYETVLSKILNKSGLFKPNKIKQILDKFSK